MTTIRYAVMAELTACSEVLRAAFHDFVNSLGRGLSDQSFAGLNSAISESRVLVGLHSRAILGVLVYSKLNDCLNIDYLAVGPGVQGKGVGSALMRALEVEAFKHSMVAIELNTVEFMAELFEMYIRRGFTVIRKGPPTHTLDSFVRVYMKKSLDFCER